MSQLRSGNLTSPDETDVTSTSSSALPEASPSNTETSNTLEVKGKVNMIVDEIQGVPR